MLVKANPDKEGAVNAGLACGKGKFGFDCAMLENKLDTPMIKDGKGFRYTDYHEAFVMVAKKTEALATKYGKDAVAVAISDRFTNEEAYTMKKLADVMGARTLCFNNRQSGVENVLGIESSPNTIDELLSTNFILAVGYNATDNPVIQIKMKQATEYKTTVCVSKHTKWVDIFEEVDTGLTYYPVAWGNWEKQKNSYHGRALVTGIIPNQIYINSMFALIMRHQQMLGFPKTLYDANVIGQWNNAVGQAIAVYDLPPDKRMADLHSVIQPADMSTQIMGCIERAMQYTKECLGATDAQLGSVNPENTSAIIALQSSSQVPLENPQANKYEWIEDIGRILLDMMGTYYGERPVVRHTTESEQIVDPQTGMPSSIEHNNTVLEMYDFSKLKNLWLNIRADVGPSTYWSRIAIVQTLDNLKQAGVIDVLDYLERMPDEYIPKKEELVAKLKKQLEAQQQQMPQLNPNSPDNNTAEVAGIPAGMQDQFQTMGVPTKNALLQQSELNRVL